MPKKNKIWFSSYYDRKIG